MDNDCPRSSCSEVKKYTLLDGATGTNLYIAGMPQGVCVEEWILAHPQAITELQREFVKAGSDILYAPTFAANREKLKFAGLESKVKEINRKLVELTRSVATRDDGTSAFIAGDLSPTGLFVEPFGETTFDELVSIYREQAEALWESGVDLFVIETMLSMTEARAAVLACRGFNKPVYVTVTVNERGKLLSGGSPLTALITLQELGIAGFGLNCSFGPSIIAEQIREIAPFAKIPLIAKPNAGQPNPLIPNVYELSPMMMAPLMEEVLDAGASIIGGCCGTTPEHIAALRELLDSYTKKEAVKYEEEHDLMLACENDFFGLDNDRIELSPPVVCELDMADALLSLCDESHDVALIKLENEEDAYSFALNAHFAKLPVCFQSESTAALSRALLLYQGRAMVDRNCSIDEEELSKIAAPYGAFLY